MPDKTGLLTQTERDRLMSHLQTTMGPRPFPCAFCHHQQWIVGNHVINDIIEITEGGSVTVPYCALFCGNCGYTVKFNAQLIKVLDQDGSAMPETVATNKVVTGKSNAE